MKRKKKKKSSPLISSFSYFSFPPSLLQFFFFPSPFSTPFPFSLFSPVGQQKFPGQRSRGGGGGTLPPACYATGLQVLTPTWRWLTHKPEVIVLRYKSYNYHHSLGLYMYKNIWSLFWHLVNFDSKIKLRSIFTLIFSLFFPFLNVTPILCIKALKKNKSCNTFHTSVSWKMAHQKFSNFLRFKFSVHYLHLVKMHPTSLLLVQ